MKPEVPAWKTCSVVTLDQVNGQGRREHVLLSSKDGNKVHRIFIHDLVRLLYQRVSGVLNR